MKGQAAMEFLMTYGWAILVVLAAIAALTYFGVLSPQKFLPETCTMPSGVACLDSQVTETEATLVLQNAIGFDMSTVSVQLDTGGCTAATAASLANADKATFTLTGCTFTGGSRAKTNINMTYTNVDSSLTHSLMGQLTKTVS
jgi:hypothetical protein